MKCPVCHGTGEYRCNILQDDKYDEMVTCGECGGTGICEQKSIQRNKAMKLNNVMTLGAKLRGFFETDWPQSMDIEMGIDANDSIQLRFHNAGSYDNGIAMMRLMGIRNWRKLVCRPEDPFTCLQAEYNFKGKTIYITIYCSGLPPTCKIETVMSKIPKSQTVDTGEFIEVPVRQIVCGE